MTRSPKCGCSRSPISAPSPSIGVDTLVAVACRELLLTDDVRARAAELAAQHPPGEGAITGSVTDMLAKLAEGIPVDGMEALLPVLRPGDHALLTDQLADGTPVLVCDPEKVRTRAADLIKTGREFLEASWSVAAMGGDVGADRRRAAGRIGIRRTGRGAGRGAPVRAPVVDVEPAVRRVGDRAGHPGRAVSARRAATRHRRHLRDAARARQRPAGTPRSSRPGREPRTAWSSGWPSPTPRQPCWSRARQAKPGCKKGWSGCSRARCTTASSSPGANLVVDHRNRSDRQPGDAHRRQAVGRQAAQHRRPAGVDGGRPGGARPARHRAVRGDGRTHRRRSAARIPGAGVRVEQSGAARPTSSTCQWIRWISCRGTSAGRRRR